MGLGYGSIIELNPLVEGQIGPGEIPKRDSGFSWYTFFSWIVTAAEIGLSFVPGIGWIGTTAIAAASAVTRLGLEAGKVGGSPSWSSFAAEGIGLALPGATSWWRRGTEILKAPGQLEAFTKDLTDVVRNTKIELKPLENMALNPEYQRVLTANKYLNELKTPSGDTFREMIANAQTNIAEKFASRTNMLGEQLGIRIPIPGEKEILEGVRAQYEAFNKTTAALRGGGEAGVGITREAEITIARKLSLTAEESAAVNAILKGLRDTRTLAQENDVIRRFINYLWTINRKDRLPMSNFLRMVAAGSARLSKTNYGEFATLAKDAFIAEQKAYKSLVLGSLKKSGVETGMNRRVAWLDSLGKFKRFQKTYDWDSLKYAALRPTSKGFNDKIVQTAQLIDPSDFGRAPAEFAYRKARNWIREKFRKAGMLGRKLNDIEKLYVKTGGELLDSSWLLGYKILTVIPGSGLRMTMISFKPSKNTHKNPVLVFATVRELELLKEAPGRFYLNRWAYFRNGPGGKKHSYIQLFSKSMRAYASTAFEAFKPAWMLASNVSALQFLKPNAIRNILSITSNWVENIADMSKGQYLNNFGAKFVTSLVRTTISRSLRLGTNTVIGGFITHALENKGISKFTQNIFNRGIGQIIGTELQRFGTNTINVIIQNGINGFAWNKGLTKSTYFKSYSKAAASYERHGLRKRIKDTNSREFFGEQFRKGRKAIKKSGGIVTLTALKEYTAKSQVYKGATMYSGARTKVATYFRAPNSVLPGRPFSKKRGTINMNSKSRSRNHGALYNSLL